MKNIGSKRRTKWRRKYMTTHIADDTTGARPSRCKNRIYEIGAFASAVGSKYTETEFDIAVEVFAEQGFLTFGREDDAKYRERRGNAIVAPCLLLKRALEKVRRANGSNKKNKGRCRVSVLEAKSLAEAEFAKRAAAYNDELLFSFPLFEKEDQVRIDAARGAHQWLRGHLLKRKEKIHELVEAAAKFHNSKLADEGGESQRQPAEEDYA
jgi:hypothetical protein